jgi:hypothetical protein
MIFATQALLSPFPRPMPPRQYVSSNQLLTPALIPFRTRGTSSRRQICGVTYQGTSLETASTQASSTQRNVRLPPASEKHSASECHLQKCQKRKQCEVGSQGPIRTSSHTNLRSDVLSIKLPGLFISTLSFSALIHLIDYLCVQCVNA